MSYAFQPDRLYRMPTHFGPSYGPRQRGEDGRCFLFDRRSTLTISVSFLTERESLEALMPPGFTLEGEPVMTVAAVYMKGIEWLAGRGYNVLEVYWRARFEGRRDHAAGLFVPVLWENLTDPILTGREELGMAKIYAELPEPVRTDDALRCTASWLGFEFFELSVRDERMVPSEQVTALFTEDLGEGMLSYKYVPRTERWGEADAAYATLIPHASPPGAVPTAVKSVRTATGRVAFRQASWSDMPTQHRIVTALADLEVRELRRALIVESEGASDLGHVRTLV